MSGHRIERLEEDMRRVLPGIFKEMKDPRVQNAMLSVVRVDLTNDLSYATVYVSSLEGLDSAKEAIKGLEHGSGFIKTSLSKSLKMRKCPDLRFVADDSIEYGAEMEKKIRDMEEQGMMGTAETSEEE